MAMRRAHSRALLIISVLCLLGIGLDFVAPDISIIEGLQEMSILSEQMGNVMADAGVGEAIASETDQAQATQLVLALVSGTGAMLGARRRQIRKTREQEDEMSKTRPIGSSCDRLEFTLKHITDDDPSSLKERTPRTENNSNIHRWWNVDLPLPTPTRLGDSMEKLLADSNTRKCPERQEAQGPDTAEGYRIVNPSQVDVRSAAGVRPCRYHIIDSGLLPDEEGGKSSGYSSLPIPVAQRRVPSNARKSGGWLGICRSRDVPADRLANRARTLIPFVYFLHLLGFTMQGPILPALRAHFHLRASETGLITSAFPTGMLVALFFYPRLSDVWGRKPVLLVCLTGVGVGFLLQTYALKLDWSFRTFLKLRILSGTFAGAAVVIKAFMADLQPEIMLRAVANREAAATLAFIVGPMLGGLIYGYGSGGILRVTFCAALMQLAAAWLVHQFLEGMPPPGGEVPKGESENTTRELPSFGLASILLCNLILIHILYTCGAAVFDSFFGVWCIDTFGWTPARLGSALTAAACFAFCTNAFGYRRYMLNPTRTVAGAVIGLASIGLSFAAMSIAKKPLVVMAILFCQSFGITFFNPSVNILIARCCPRGSRGVIFATDSIACSLGRICSPSIAGHFYDLGPGAAFRVVSWALMTAAGLMASKWRLLNSLIRTR
ncbi:psiT2 [Symbiodinium sp. CCMP2592]|nr:psiT2 [Symbiodinium sp. CCMP2592]